MAATHYGPAMLRVGLLGLASAACLLGGCGAAVPVQHQTEPLSRESRQAQLAEPERSPLGATPAAAPVAEEPIAGRIAGAQPAVAGEEHDEQAVSEANGFERDCRAGSVQGCLGLARAFVFGTGRRQDLHAAEKLYERACELDRASGCYAFGLAEYGGHGVRKNQRRGRELLDVACSAGQKEACRFLAEVAPEP